MKKPLMFTRARIELASVMAVTATAIAACGGTSTTGPDGGSGGGTSGSTTTSNPGSGSSTSGHSSGTNSSTGSVSASCTSVTACGGNAVGTWTVGGSCLAISGKADLSMLGVGCTSAPVTGSLMVSGSWTIKSGGSWVDNTHTTGTETLQLSASCLTISGTTTTCTDISGPLGGLGYSNVTCTDAAGGGCSCTATVDQMGGLGVVSASAGPTDTYTTGSNALTDSEGTKYSYCVSGGMLTVTPETTSPTTAGTIVLSGSGSSASSSTTSASGSTSSSTSSTTSSGSTAALTGPCDIYAGASPATPCVAAYSTVRRLLSTYTGPLYQVRKGGTRNTFTGDQPLGTVGGTTGGTTQEIGVVAGGYADAAAQDSFCSGSTCTVSKIYDQSGKGNDLTEAGAGNYTGTAHQPDYESNATKKSITVNGHNAYALYMIAQDGYRNDSTKGMPTGSADQGIYEVADGTHAGTACCWDFGNARTDNSAGGTGTMSTIYFGTGFWGKGAGSGPWMMGDFEAGVWSGGSGASGATNPNDPSLKIPYAFGIVDTYTSGGAQYTIKAGDATTGTLATAYDGKAPQSSWSLSGAVILGIGGDNSNSSFGTLYEGAITAGHPSATTEQAVFANVQAAKYGQ